MDLAFVKHSTQINSRPYFGDLTLLFNKLSTAGIKYDIRAWNDPNVIWTQYSHIIFTSQIDYDCHFEEFLQWFHRMEKLEQESMFTLLNSSQVVKWNYNKKYLLELEEKKINIPATVYVERNSDKNVIASLIINGLKKYVRRINEIVVKNAIGAGGRSVWRCKLIEKSDGVNEIPSSAIDRLYQQLISAEGQYGILIQEFMPTIFNEGEWSLVYFNKKFSHAVIKRPKPRNNAFKEKGNDTNDIDEAEFRVHRFYGGFIDVVPNGDVPESLIYFGERVLATLPEDLLHARVDILMGEDKMPYLLELEVFDMLLYISEPVVAGRYMQAIMELCNC